MDTEERLPAPNGVSPFERIRRTSAAGAQYWSSRDFAQILSYSDYRNFEQVVKWAKTACFNSGQRVEDHFGGIWSQGDPNNQKPWSLRHTRWTQETQRRKGDRGCKV